MSDPSKHLAVLFADISGSVRLYERLQKNEAKLAVERCLKRIQLVIEGFSGKMVSLEGDEIMAVFDTVDHACLAAIDMQKRVGDLPPSSGVKLTVRVGFAFGSVSQAENEYTGETVNIAACLAGVAKPGEVLTSQIAVAAMSAECKPITREYGKVVVNRSLQTIQAVEILIPKISSRYSKPSVGREMSLKTGHKERYLKLLYLDKLLTLEKSGDQIKIGRHAEVDVQLEDFRTSRDHAKIVKDGNLYFLIDDSTNGSFITIEGEPEIFLHRDKMVLDGQGMISFGASIRSLDADFVEFKID